MNAIATALADRKPSPLWRLVAAGLALTPLTFIVPIVVGPLS